MNTKSGDQLKHSAETGDIELLYAVIQDDPSILETIDKNQFVETPLHTAASSGHLEFAIEIMNLKPTFALKLNLQGYSPIHLAMDSLTHLAMDSLTHLDMESRILLQTEMVSYLVGINKDLVRVKGREGLTQLHFASKKGDVELLAEFLTACPDSIEDVTVRGESALHIAVINQQFEALQVLVGWLKENVERGARKLEEKILNHKDKAGNTVLHISALGNDPKFLQFLVKSGIKINAQNSRKETALDLASTPEIKNILVHAKAKQGSEISKAPTRAEQLRSKTTFIDYTITGLRRLRRNISNEQRNIWLIVATVVATANYESVLNSPGGVLQASASNDKNAQIKSADFFSTKGNAGKSVMSKYCFAVFSIANLVSCVLTTATMLILSPSQPLGRLLFVTVQWLAVGYLTALLAISPTHFNNIIIYIMISFIASSMLILEMLHDYFEYQQSKKLNIPNIFSVLKGKVRELINYFICILRFIEFMSFFCFQFYMYYNGTYVLHLIFCI